jgi:hypothetical protein
MKCTCKGLTPTPEHLRVGCYGITIARQIELEIIDYIRNYEFIFIDKLVGNLV